MTQIARLGAFDRPFQVRLVDGEILIESDQAAVELVFTLESARATAKGMLDAVDAAVDPPRVR